MTISFRSSNFNYSSLKSASYLEVELVQCSQLYGDTENFLDGSGIKVKKVNRTTRGLVGNITYHVPLDDSYFVESQFYKKQGGEYRLMPYKTPSTGFCNAVKNDIYFYPELVKFSNYPMPLPCPLTPVSI